MMRVWLVSEVFYPEDTGTGYYMTGVAEGLAERFDVRVLCSQPTYAARGSLSPWSEIHRGVQIERCKGTTFNKDVLILRLANVVTISLSLFLKTLQRIRKSDVVIVVTNPPLLPFFVALTCRLRGAKCILRVDDVYPEAITAAGLARPNSIIVRILSWMTNRLYQTVDHIVVLGRDMERLAKEKIGHSTKRKIDVIPIWADVNLVMPTMKQSNTLLHELGLMDKFVVLCAGNMGRAQGVENMLKAAEILKGNQSIHFLFIGSGAKRQWMENEVQQQKMYNVTLLDQRPRSDQPIFLNACDIAMVSLLPGMTGAGVPSRLYNILAAGRPVLAVTGLDSEIALVVDEECIGWCVHPDQPSKLAEAILEAKTNPSRLLRMGKHARMVAESKYSPERIIEAYAGLIEDVMAAQERLF